MQFLARVFMQGFPIRYTSQDASQPWLLFWTIQSFSLLQVGLDPDSRQRVIDKIMTWQHPDGGFGGGPGQAAHLLATYASVCALAIAGRPGPGGGWDQINREKLYEFFMSLKQPDGSFLVTHHAEVDVRGIYCLIVTATLLDLLTPELVAGTAAFIASCQTYEGGFASSSHPTFTPGPTPALLSSPRPPLGEAHGGYTFCALASWVLLQPLLAAEDTSTRPSIDLQGLLRWLVDMQGTEIELGGFRGRTNKLVDGCYSWWAGGAFALLEALGVNGARSATEGHHAQPTDAAREGTWDDVDDSLFDRKALQEYILFAGQHPTGGLRDKPPKSVHVLSRPFSVNLCVYRGADAYHTLYCLSGLSAAQHHIFPSLARHTALADAWVPSNNPHDDLRRTIFSTALSWTEEDGASKIVGGPSNRVNATHPIFNLTITHAEGLMAHFYSQKVPPRARGTS
ncbi:terpenoid cyclases/protein prenyltransferase alpha-alpha toroid [Infundibulicybe gibba]|nr:terpenoid cyclases/protein prenyltransferase alpha-alpha toroid [Infundibulicybe gibba]